MRIFVEPSHSIYRKSQLDVMAGSGSGVYKITNSEVYLAVVREQNNEARRTGGNFSKKALNVLSFSKCLQ